jgi:C4-dicarboxylate-specific signal transduction histidine kinase
MPGDAIWQEWVEERLLQADHLLTSGQMAAEVAHQINNSLESIKNYLYLLRQDVPEVERSNELSIVEEELRRIADLTGQLASFQRRGRSFGSAPVRTVLERVLGLLSGRMRRLGIRAEWGPFDETFQTHAAPELTQIFFHLVLNAIESMPHGGTLELRAEQHSSGLTVVLRDTGTGIAAEELERIFEPFFSRKPMGLGLGLPVCRKLAGRIDAEMELKSQPDVGTAVALHLRTAPVAPPRAMTGPVEL